MAFSAWPRALLLLSGLAASSVFEGSLANAASFGAKPALKLSEGSEDCYRECVAGEAPRVCKYSFYEEVYNGVNESIRAADPKKISIMCCHYEPLAPCTHSTKAYENERPIGQSVAQSSAYAGPR